MAHRIGILKLPQSALDNNGLYTSAQAGKHPRWGGRNKSRRAPRAQGRPRSLGNWAEGRRHSSAAAAAAVSPHLAHNTTAITSLKRPAAPKPEVPPTCRGTPRAMERDTSQAHLRRHPDAHEQEPTCCDVQQRVHPLRALATRRSAPHRLLQVVRACECRDNHYRSGRNNQACDHTSPLRPPTLCEELAGTSCGKRMPCSSTAVLEHPTNRAPTAAFKQRRRRERSAAPGASNAAPHARHGLTTESDNTAMAATPSKAAARPSDPCLGVGRYNKRRSSCAWRSCGLRRSTRGPKFFGSRLLAPQAPAKPVLRRASMARTSRLCMTFGQPRVTSTTR